MRSLRDPLLILLAATMVLAFVVPVRGTAATLASWCSQAAIFALFFLNGVRLRPAEVLGGLRNWRLQGATALFVFGAMPLAGMALAAACRALGAPVLASGLLFLGLLPSTVQSAAAYSALAGGNIAASVVAAGALNLAGILVSPLLLGVIGGVAGSAPSGAMLGKVATLLLLPFVLGQLSQRWTRHHVLHRKALFAWMDRASIAIAVYVALSGAIVAGSLAELAPVDIAAMAAALVVFLAFGFGGAWLLSALASPRREDRIAMLFAGAHKSVAVGAPLAALAFPPAQAGRVLIPLIAYHMAQLVVSAVLASRLAASSAAGTQRDDERGQSARGKADEQPR